MSDNSPEHSPVEGPSEDISKTIALVFHVGRVNATLSMKDRNHLVNVLNALKDEDVRNDLALSLFNNLKDHMEDGWIDETFEAIENDEYWFTTTTHGTHPLTGVDTDTTPHERYLKVIEIGRASCRESVFRAV